MAAALRLAIIIAIIVPATIFMSLLQMALIVIAPKLSLKLPRLWHRFFLFMIGVRVHVHGKMCAERPLLLVANHVSWSDIMVLGSVGELCFIAKDEVKTWPGINWLARLQRTVFVNREAKREVGVQADTIAARLVSGDAMVLFAEGTTGNGNRLLSFKSALFGAPQMALQQSGFETIYIQPVAIAYNTLHGMPLGRYHQAIASWPGDLELLPHLKRFLLEGAFDVDVAFDEVLPFTAETKRKRMADQTSAIVQHSFAKLRRQYHRS